MLLTKFGPPMINQECTYQGFPTIGATLGNKLTIAFSMIRYTIVQLEFTAQWLATMGTTRGDKLVIAFLMIRRVFMLEEAITPNRTMTTRTYKMLGMPYSP
jgi:hypothetical protein